jgi:hypothetical protein
MLIKVHNLHTTTIGKNLKLSEEMFMLSMVWQQKCARKDAITL